MSIKIFWTRIHGFDLSVCLGLCLDEKFAKKQIPLHFERCLTQKGFFREKEEDSITATYKRDKHGYLWGKLHVPFLYSEGKEYDIEVDNTCYALYDGPLQFENRLDLSDWLEMTFRDMLGHEAAITLSLPEDSEIGYCEEAHMYLPYRDPVRALAKETEVCEEIWFGEEEFLVDF